MKIFRTPSFIAWFIHRCGGFTWEEGVTYHNNWCKDYVKANNEASKYKKLYEDECKKTKKIKQELLDMAEWLC